MCVALFWWVVGDGVSLPTTPFCSVLSLCRCTRDQVQEREGMFPDRRTWSPMFPRFSVCSCTRFRALMRALLLFYSWFRLCASAGSGPSVAGLVTVMLFVVLKLNQRTVQSKRKEVGGETAVREKRSRTVEGGDPKGETA